MTTDVSITVPGAGLVSLRFPTPPTSPPTPGRMLLNFAGTAFESLYSGSFNIVTHHMLSRSWGVGSGDLPGHGLNLLPGETYSVSGHGLQNWANRAKAHRSVADDCVGNIQLICNELIALGYTTAGRIAVSGVSRGGFAAIHGLNAVAAVAAGVAFNPVTGPKRLAEFNSHYAAGLAITEDMRVGNLFHCTKPLYIESSNYDTRVGVPEGLMNLAEMASRSREIEFHLRKADNHAIPFEAELRAANWLDAIVL